MGCCSVLPWAENGTRNSAGFLVTPASGGGAWEWPWYWCHSASGVRSLARRIQVVEVVYEILANLFRSNLLDHAIGHVFQAYADVSERTGQPVTRWRLQEATGAAPMRRTSTGWTGGLSTP